MAQDPFDFFFISVYQDCLLNHILTFLPK